MSSQNKPLIVVDTDIIQDFLRKQEPFYKNAKIILDSIFENACKAILDENFWCEYRIIVWAPEIGDHNTSDDISAFLGKIHDVFIYDDYPYNQRNLTKEPGFNEIFNFLIHSRADFFITRDEKISDIANDIGWNEQFPKRKIIHPETFTQEISQWHDRQPKPDPDIGPSL